MTTVPRKPAAVDAFPWGWFWPASIAGWIAAKTFRSKIGGLNIDGVALGLLLGWLVAQLVRLQRRWLKEHDFRSGQRREANQ